MQESIQLVIDSLPFLLKGAGYTLQLSIGGMFFGLLLGFILALMRLSPIWPVRWLARFYISIFRGTPLIAQLFMGSDSNLLIVFYVQIMPDDLVMQLHRF